MNERFQDCPNILKRIVEERIGEKDAASPKVSVIIPAYNIAPFVVETLDSVFAQSYPDFEVIIINDGSQDTEKLEAELAPYFEKIIYARQQNLGASKARNTAICLARGELIAFLDGDDIWFPEYLATQIEFLEKNDLEMVYCNAALFGEPLYEGRTFMQDSPSKGQVSPVTLINGDCNVITSGTVLKKDLLQKFEMFDTELKRMQDFDLWFRLSKNGVRIDYQTKILIKYRVRPNSLSGSNVDRSERNISALHVINDKYNLDEREKAVWEKQLKLCEAELELERGKLCLVQGNFSNARTHFTKANEFFRKPKLSLINWLMRFSPKLTLQLFKKIRPSEFSFISPDKS